MKGQEGPKPEAGLLARVYLIMARTILYYIKNKTNISKNN